jgi:hypothetical protein
LHPLPAFSHVTEGLWWVHENGFQGRSTTDARYHAGDIVGYKALPEASEAGVSKATQVWQISAQGTLLAAETRADVSSTTSRVKVQGDRSMRIRYLNPNTVLFVSGAATGV